MVVATTIQSWKARVQSPTSARIAAAESELRAAVERIVAEGAEDVVQIEHILPVLQLHRAHSPFVPSGNLREARQRFERDYIASMLQHHDWRMAPAAQALGIQRPNLYRKARQLGIPLVRVSE